MHRFRRVRQKQSARQKQERHTFSIASIVEEVQDAMCYIDFSKHRLYTNHLLRHWCPSMTTQSFATTEALTRFLYKIFEEHGADMAQVTHLIQELLECETEKWPSMTSRRIQFDDRTLHLIFNFTRTPRGVFIMWRDQTEAVRFEERKDAFLAELSHDFRTPLTAIHGYTELLMARHEGSEKSYHMLEQVKQESERLERLVDNFLDYQKESYTAEQLTVTTFALRPLLADVMASYQTMSPLHSVTFETNDVWIQADEEKLRQLLHNLIGNAIKYSPDGGTVHTQVEECDGTIILSVSDTGIGIPEDALPYVFDEYYRVDSLAHQSIKGTGLGLRICKRIAEAHGWGIHADSTYGEGTTFTIELHTRHTCPLPRTSFTITSD
ncbi:sensor histidine kinase [Exiguobacterium sp. B2(2022)]|uniref:sensor histidine kinase n=1 Tax=Exiguobacterium sp. B2(2022) TaxID=2992755 RepID=UPI00237BF3A9|nr:HAMP domain-containing sensor histidine kinase [Exiguobacterium sp. B2(2022)]MDE0562466.1 HAMP domain-containing histidine kinase [Exiguobacterium sp. B2(2022)]